MTMNSSGPISLGGATAGQSINLENGFSATAQVSLNDTAVRNLAGVASGAITMPTNFYGKSNRVSISYTFSSNTANASLNLSSISGYSAGKSDITVTINGGVYLYATSTGSYGLNLSGGTSGDALTIVNNGFIMGQGGNSTNDPNNSTPLPGLPGGPALNLGFGMSSCTINNTNGSAYIGGGGGGGGGARGDTYGSSYPSGGGGAGGGSAWDNNGQGGGQGGGIGSSGSSGVAWASNAGGGGGGGRIFPGSGGTPSYPYGGGGGAGGAAGAARANFAGAGGSANNSGGNGGGSGESVGAGGGGGWGASGGSGVNYNTGGTKAGGAGGKAVNTNGKSVTWTSGNTTRVYGAVS